MNEELIINSDVLKMLKETGIGNLELIKLTSVVDTDEIEAIKENGYTGEFIQSKEDLEKLKEEETVKNEKLMQLAQKTIASSEWREYEKEIEKKISDIVAKLETVSLTNLEWNDLIYLVRQNNFIKSLHNTIDLAIFVGIGNVRQIEEIKEGQALVSGNHNTLLNYSLNSLFADYDLDNMDIKQFISELSSNFEDTLETEFDEDKLNASLTDTTDLFDKYNSLNSYCVNYIVEHDGIGDIGGLIERDVTWNDYYRKLEHTIHMTQVAQIDSYIEEARQYRTEKENGEIVYQIGNEEITISRDTLVDDIAKIAQKINEYKKETEMAKETSEIKVEPVNIENYTEEINPEAQAYADFIISGMEAQGLEVDREAIIERASNPEVLEEWINSPLSVSAYENAKSNGEIEQNLTYEGYQSLKMDETMKLEEQAAEEKDEEFSEEVNEDQKKETQQFTEIPKDLSGLDKFVSLEVPSDFDYYDPAISEPRQRGRR